MARLPSWMEQVGRERLSEDGKSAIVTIRIKRWHPYVWWLYLRRAIRAVRLAR